MKYLALFTLPVLLATAFAWADNRPADADRAHQLHTNLDLVQSLVDGGLMLSREDDPIHRANYCNSMAERFATEIRKANEEQDARRVIELSGHLKNLLNDGVAPNLGLAREAIPSGSSDERKLHDVRDRTNRMVGQLETDLQRAINAPQSELRHVLDGVQEGRSQVERATKGRQ